MRELRQIIMTRSISNYRPLIAVGTVAIAFTTIFIIAQNLDWNQSSQMSWALTADLLITIPLVYALIIWKTKVPKTTVVPVLIAGLVLGNYVLPESEKTFLNLFIEWVLPVVELSVLGFVIFKVRQVIRTFKHQKETSTDFFDVVKKTCAELFPKTVSLLVATEIAVIYYGFFRWKKRKQLTNEFTHHKSTGSFAVLVAMIMAVLVETAVLHILLINWNATVTWILSALSLYTAFQVFGIARSLSQRPFAALNDAFVLRYGIMAETELAYSQIASIERTSRDLNKDEGEKPFSPLGDLEGHNVIVTLKAPLIIRGLYGMKKEAIALALHLDDPQSFIERFHSKQN